MVRSSLVAVDKKPVPTRPCVIAGAALPPISAYAQYDTANAVWWRLLSREQIPTGKYWGRGGVIVPVDNIGIANTVVSPLPVAGITHDHPEQRGARVG